MPAAIEEKILETTAPQPVIDPQQAYEASRATPPAEEPKAAEPKVVEPTSVPVETTEGSKEQGEKPKRDRTAEGRIAELTAQLKAEREELARFREERQTREAANQPKPAETPKADKKPESATGKPFLKDFVAQLKGDETYEDAQERWNDAVQDWRDKQAEAKNTEQATAKQQTEFQAKVESKFEEYRGKYEDFDEVVESKWAPPSLHQAAAQFIREFDNAYDVLYQLAKDPAEVTRIAALSPARQLAELGKLEDRLSKPEPKTPPIPPVSKAPAPIRQVGGSSSAEPENDLTKATSQEEYERMRRKQMKKK